MLLFVNLCTQVVPKQSPLDNAGENMDVVLTPHSFTSFDLLRESGSIKMKTDSLSRSSI